ncbi:PRC-barrel domain-containing protein [Microvirga splendida]|uniref:PRC-barrel domain-containing protein n=1 Tax=Microvirga splendida TaxID=2795727 RepID=A0ABS0Y3E0_9HYPH|nr:PRC-barrel domain-containing protein [Microvirga splendida]MBJ6126818.1 PRC-barrel domain-containing protein [Microvirga splendida]
MKGFLLVALLGAAMPGLGTAAAQTAPSQDAGQMRSPAPGAPARVPLPPADAPLPYQPMRVGELENREIYSTRGEMLGSVKRVVLDVTDGITFIVLERGGFVGIGEKEFPLPADRLYTQGGRLVVPGLTDAELDNAADWDVRDQKYREMADSEIINVARR